MHTAASESTDSTSGAKGWLQVGGVLGLATGFTFGGAAAMLHGMKGVGNSHLPLAIVGGVGAIAGVAALVAAAHRD